MGLFSKKESKETTSKNSEESVLKNELDTEVEKLQTEFRIKQGELQDVTQKIQTVKEEYDDIVSKVMVVKKEYNQKKMELDVVSREYKEIKEKIINSEQIKDSKSIEKFNKTEENLSKTEEALGKITKEHSDLLKQITTEQSKLHIIKKQQLESEKELEEANSRLYNAKQELEKKDYFEETSILTHKEKEFIQGENENKQSSTGVIEAASIVVGSLKSKLNITQKELGTVQTLLEKERKEHEKVKEELEKIKASLPKES